MLNYLDETDVRSREIPWTIEAQLLNAAACALDESDLRLSREVRACQKGKTPLNLDNRGVWHQVQVPYASGAIGSFQGVIDGQVINLKPYDDLFPAPTRVSSDSARSIVPLADLLLFSVDGDGLPRNSGPISLAIPNRLYLWVEGLESGAVEIQLEGYTHPRAFWASASEPIIEKLTAVKAGPLETEHTWESIQDITVRGLPTGASLKVCLFPAGFAYQPDVMRPYTDPAYRDVTFPSFWTVDGRIVREEFFNQQFYGFQTAQTYFNETPIRSVTVEPNTFGILAASGSTLIYADRREPAPDGLSRTALTEEPLFGLQVSYDRELSSDQRYVSLKAIPYAGAPNLVQYRYTVEDPNGGHWLITKAGDLARLTSNLGWNRGTPSDVSLSLPNSQCGTWMFGIECSDQAGHRTYDRAPYLHAALNPIASFDVSSVVPELAAAIFDSRERLWLWTGDLLVPAVFSYDAYVYDEAGRALYLTDSYDEVRLS